MANWSSTKAIQRLAFIGNYLPRQCGIATFTTDLCEALAAEYVDIKCIALLVNDTAAAYDYRRVELCKKDLASYHRAADFLNINNVDLVGSSSGGFYGACGGSIGTNLPRRFGWQRGAFTFGN